MSSGSLISSLWRSYTYIKVYVNFIYHVIINFKLKDLQINDNYIQISFYKLYWKFTSKGSKGQPLPSEMVMNQTFPFDYNYDDNVWCKSLDI